MIQYNSCFSNMIEEFVRYRKASQCWSDISYGRNLKTFDNYCINTFPNEITLTQEMIDSWCRKRETETHRSHSSRISVIIALVKYTNSRKLTNLRVPECTKRVKSTYIPHTFTDEELFLFFYACDTYEIKIRNLNSRLNQITFPVFFRLLYSSGMRTTEARLLRADDVNLETGVINIRESKGYHQHFVVLHDSMIELLRWFDNEVKKMMPVRTYFFPVSGDRHHEKSWVSKNFKKLWTKYNEDNAVAYDLRHHYAITNINKWVDNNIEFHTKLYYLSKSMGHSSIESTKYYYSLIPAVADIFEKQVRESFEDIIGEVEL